MRTIELQNEEFWWIEIPEETENISYSFTDRIYTELEGIWIDAGHSADSSFFSGRELNAPNLQLISITVRSANIYHFLQGITLNAPKLKYIQLSGEGAIKCFRRMTENINPAPVLEGISLIDTGITEIPDFILNTGTLTSLNFRNEKLTGIPASLFNLVNLEHLRFEYCTDIRVIPDEIRNLVNLGFFGLWGASLAYLSPELFRLPRLTGVDMVSTHYEPDEEMLNAVGKFMEREEVQFGLWENFNSEHLFSGVLQENSF
ncbi:MAG: hypothetical protein WCK34_06205 [Bacteroidota bacterium]